VAEALEIEEKEMKKKEIKDRERNHEYGRSECGTKVPSGNKISMLIPYRKGEKWGFCDRNKNMVIQPAYDLVDTFDEGLVSVQLNGKWGLIDTGGSTVVPVTYDRAFPFNDGVVAVELNGKWGYIDTKGTPILGKTE
jgi:hypothetical protein